MHFLKLSPKWSAWFTPACVNSPPNLRMKRALETLRVTCPVYGSITSSSFRGFNWILRLKPSNLSFSRIYFSWTIFSKTSCSSYTFSTDISLLMSIVLIFSWAICSTYWSSFGFLSFISFNLLPNSLRKSGSLVFIFIFCFGVLSPCLNTATTDRNSHVFLFF